MTAINITIKVAWLFLKNNKEISATPLFNRATNDIMDIPTARIQLFQSHRRKRREAKVISQKRNAFLCSLCIIFQ
jgi:hypothetical protein